MKNFLEALRSGWRAGLKQYRHRRTQLRNQAAKAALVINQPETTQ